MRATKEHRLVISQILDFSFDFEIYDKIFDFYFVTLKGRSKDHLIQLNIVGADVYLMPAEGTKNGILLGSFIPISKKSGTKKFKPIHNHFKFILKEILS